MSGIRNSIRREAIRFNDSVERNIGIKLEYFSTISVFLIIISVIVATALLVNAIMGFEQFDSDFAISLAFAFAVIGIAWGLISSMTTCVTMKKEIEKLKEIILNK